MIANWVHLSLIHLAVLGFPAVLTLAIINRKKMLDKWVIGLSLLFCFITFIGYISGPKAYENLTAYWESQEQMAPAQEPGLFDAPVSQIENHAMLGRIFFLLAVVLAALLLVTGLQTLQGQAAGRGMWITVLIILFGLTCVGLITAHEGGKIRRPELRHVLEDTDTL